MDNNRCKIKKIIAIIIISQVVILIGCSQNISNNNKEEKSTITEDYESKKDNNILIETDVMIEDSTQIEIETAGVISTNIETETIKFDGSENELIKEDFEVKYKGYIINAQTSEKDIKEKLGVPEDFEINNNGYISTEYPNWIWQLRYPNYMDESDIRVTFYTNLDTDVTNIKKVTLEKIATSRGVIVGDSVEKIYEVYGVPDEEKVYNNISGLLEINYINADQMLSFVIDEENRTVKYIYIEYNIEDNKNE